MKTKTPSFNLSKFVRRVAPTLVPAAATLLLIGPAISLWATLDALFSGKLWIVAGSVTLLLVFAALEWKQAREGGELTEATGSTTSGSTLAPSATRASRHVQNACAERPEGTACLNGALLLNRAK